MRFKDNKSTIQDHLFVSDTSNQLKAQQRVIHILYIDAEKILKL